MYSYSETSDKGHFKEDNLTTKDKSKYSCIPYFLDQKPYSNKRRFEDS